MGTFQKCNLWMKLLDLMCKENSFLHIYIYIYENTSIIKLFLKKEKEKKEAIFIMLA